MGTNYVVATVWWLAVLRIRDILTDLDADPDPRILDSDLQIQMRTREAQKHTDPERWYIYIILQR